MRHHHAVTAPSQGNGFAAAVGGGQSTSGLASLGAGLDSRLRPEELVARNKLAGLESTPLAHGHDHATGHGAFGRVTEAPLSATDQRAFDAQWTAAANAAHDLATIEAATAAGYVQVSSQTPGVGTHWLKWSLIDAPFSPAAPSMLLFDQVPGRSVRLLGFSYWVRTETEPTGFAGPNDHWHGHEGLCFVEGWLQREGVASPSDCEGYWLNGGDLWMLHAWVVADASNRWGRLAPTNPALCPSRREAPDVLTCDEDNYR
jgi:hypothetical protein